MAEAEEKSASAQEEKLKDELARTVQELNARQARLLAAETELASVRYKLERLRQGARARVDVAALKSQEAYRRVVLEKYEKARRQREECVAEVARARERKELIEADIEALGAGTTEEVKAQGEQGMRS